VNVLDFIDEKEHHGVAEGGCVQGRGERILGLGNIVKHWKTVT
jgi:hypothetical protein